MALDKIREMIQPNATIPDNTKHEAYQVFGEKSVEGNELQRNALKMLTDAGMTEEDILGMVMGSQNTQMGAMNPTPQTVKGGLGVLENISPAGMGGVLKSLKGLGGGLKGLAGKIGSKAKFPKGYGAPQSPGQSPELPTFIRITLDKQMNPMQQMQNEQQTRSTIQRAIQQLMNPNTVIKEEDIQKALKGMRKTGIRG